MNGVSQFIIDHIRAGNTEPERVAARFDLPRELAAEIIARVEADKCPRSAAARKVYQ
jgi:hypothetical protein